MLAGDIKLLSMKKEITRRKVRFLEGYCEIYHYNRRNVDRGGNNFIMG